MKKTIWFIFAIAISCNCYAASDKAKDIEECLNSPGIIEKFKKTQGRKSSRKKDKQSPLVKEAESFQLYLNPPRKVEVPVKKINKRTKSIVKAPPRVSAKFKVVGTSYAEGNPAMSLALLDITGEGLRWKRQGEKVGHLTIEEVKPDGTVLLKDGKNISEMRAETKPLPNFLKGQQPDMKQLQGQVQTMLSNASTTAAKPAKRAPAKAAPKQLSEEEIKKQQQVMQDLMQQVQKMFKEAGEDTNSPQTTTPPPADDSSKKPPAPARPPAPKADDTGLSITTVQQASELMNEISEKFAELEKDTDSKTTEDIETAVQEDAEKLRKAILKFRSTPDLSEQDTNQLTELNKELAKIQQDIRRSQSRRRIENARKRGR